jgi:hypothetical protein
MVSVESVEKQLKRLKFNVHGWGRSEVRELHRIVMEGEEIYECVNGMYEGGFALLVATDSRVLLIDKKPLNYLTVEDLRFDMINELDYSHRLLGAHITISAGSKSLTFKSYNQPRLRKLITHVQHCMAESKKSQSAGQQDQKQHLEQINQQLQAYLIAQHQQQETLREQLKGVGSNSAEAATVPESPKPSPALSDFLFAQSLLKQYREQETAQAARPEATQSTPAETQFFEATVEPVAVAEPAVASAAIAPPQLRQLLQTDASPHLADLYAEGMKEIFGRQNNQQQEALPQPEQPMLTATAVQAAPAQPTHNPLEINALSIAYSKLPMALRNRKFGRPSFHAHSQAAKIQQITQYPAPAN